MTVSANQRPIQKPVALVVEGKDYLHLLLSQIDGPPEFQDIQLWDYAEGGQDFPRWLRNFCKMRGFGTLRSLGVICDAEANSTGTEAKIKQAMRSCGLPVPSESNLFELGPPKTGYLIMPHGEESGCLENAMLKAALPEVKTDCVAKFLDCIGDTSRNENWRAKVKVHASIAASTNPAATLGQSGKLGLWNFLRPELKVMLDFAAGLSS